MKDHTDWYERVTAILEAHGYDPQLGRVQAMHPTSGQTWSYTALFLPMGPVMSARWVIRYDTEGRVGVEDRYGFTRIPHDSEAWDVLRLILEVPDTPGEEGHHAPDPGANSSE